MGHEVDVRERNRPRAGAVDRDGVGHYVHLFVPDSVGTLSRQERAVADPFAQIRTEYCLSDLPRDVDVEPFKLFGVRIVVTQKLCVLIDTDDEVPSLQIAPMNESGEMLFGAGSGRSGRRLAL